MRKYFLFVFVSLLVQLSFGQHTPGFLEDEAIDMAKICNSYSAWEIHGTDKDYIPEQYHKIFSSKSLGMDNAFQVYADNTNKKGVIHFRGSTAKKSSWMENFYATLIPANETIKVEGKKFNYNASEAKGAYIHAGYTLAFYYLQDAILEQIESLNKRGIYTIYITGHSQGGALAQMCMALLDNLPNREVKQKNAFKVYAFANPMIGNVTFANDYNKRFCETGLSYLIHNPKDVVTKMPIAYNDTTFLKSMVDELSNNPEFSAQAMLYQGAFAMIKNQISTMANSMFSKVEAQIFAELGKIELPADKQTKVQYCHTGNRTLIEPADYTNVKMPESKSHLPKEIEGTPIGVLLKNLMKSVDGQHKAYNYYTGLLKKFRPLAYQNLKEKVFIPKA